MDLRSASAKQLADAISSGSLSSEDATSAAIARLKPVHDACNAVLTFEDDEALESARAADRETSANSMRGPLHGVPLAHKDMFDRTGKIASWGANVRSDTPATSDATVIARLKDAGALQIAALHLTEFAFGPTGHNYIHGHAKNPWNHAHITGGSSSGSAVSVATGVVPAALGSDTAGSLRLPAAACGVKSLKGTWTRVSRAGCMPLSGSLDCVGPIARHMEDIALLFGLIAGHDPRDGASARAPVADMLAALQRPATGLRIGIDRALLTDADPSVQSAIEEALRTLGDAGCTSVDVTFDDWKEIDDLTQLLQLPEVASAHGAMMRNRFDDYGPQVRNRIAFGHFVPGADHQTATRARGMLIEQVIDQVFGNCDAAILPTFADPLPTIAELDVAGGPTFMAKIGRVIQFTRPINYLALPALTMPYPDDVAGLPNGFQLVARPFAEDVLITLGAAYERAVPPKLAPDQTS